MKRNRISVLMISLLLLCGCSKEQAAEERFLAFRESVQDCYLVLDAEITADYGETVESYTIASRETTEGTDLEVLAPEEVEGIRASTDGEAYTLSYDGAILGVGPLTASGVTPLSALPVLADALCNAHVERCWEEVYNGRETLAVSLCIDETTTATLWLAADDLTPCFAELAENGKTVLFYTVTNWSTNG